MFLKSTKYFLSFVIIGFLLLSGLVCHTNKAAQADSQNLSDDCHGRKENLINQDDFSLSLKSKQISSLKDLINGEGLFNLTEQENKIFNSLQYSSNQQIDQFFTVIKIE